MFKILQLSSHKEYIILTFYLTSAYCNLTSGDSTAADPELHQNTHDQPSQPINSSTSYIYMVLKHPPTHQRKSTLVIALTHKSAKDHLQTTTSNSSILELFKTLQNQTSPADSKKLLCTEAPHVVLHNMAETAKCSQDIN